MFNFAAPPLHPLLRFKQCEEDAQASVTAVGLPRWTTGDQRALAPPAGDSGKCRSRELNEMIK